MKTNTPDIIEVKDAIKRYALDVTKGEIFEIGQGAFVYYDDYAALKARAEKAEEKVKLAEARGLTFGMMKTSDKPEPYLVSDFREGSELHKMFRLITENIDLEHRAKKAEALYRGIQRVLRALVCNARRTKRPQGHSCRLPGAERGTGGGVYKHLHSRPFSPRYENVKEDCADLVRAVLSCPPNPEYVAVKKQDLRILEWREETWEGIVFCRYCNHTITEGHAKTCWLGRALKEE